MAHSTQISLKVELLCECGRPTVARSKDAGSTIHCACGRSVSVPSLSRLRTLAGRDAFVTNPAEAIETAIRNGEKPAGDRCVMCGATDPSIYTCHATCETTCVKGGEHESNDMGRLFWLTAVFLVFKFLLFAFWWRGIFGFRRRSEEFEIRGHDVGASFPLPVCDSCSSTAGGVTQVKVAKHVMSKVPMYKALLDHYPQLELRVEQSISSLKL